MGKSAAFAQPNKKAAEAVPSVDDFVAGAGSEDRAKLTVRLPDKLHRHLKASCAISGESLQERIERLVQADLELERARQRSDAAA